MEYSMEQLTVTGLINVSSPLASRCSFALIKYVANSRQDILWKTFSRFSSLLSLETTIQTRRLPSFRFSHFVPFFSSLLFLFVDSDPFFWICRLEWNKNHDARDSARSFSVCNKENRSDGRSLGGKYGALTDRMLIEQHNAPHRRDFAISRMTYMYLTERFSSVNTSRSILRFTASTKTGQKPDEFERFLIRKTRVVVFLRQTSKESDNRIV